MSIFALKLSTFSISHSMQVLRNRVHRVKMDAIKFAAYAYLLDDVQSCIHNYYNILLALTKCLSFTFIQLSYWLKKIIIVIFIIIIIFIIINILFCFFLSVFWPKYLSNVYESGNVFTFMIKFISLKVLLCF